MGAKGTTHTPKELRNPAGWPHTEEQRQARLVRMREYARARRANDPEYVERDRAFRSSPEGRAKTNATARRWRAERRQYLHEVKLAAGCTDCGYRSHAEALQFDHVRGPKEFELGSRLNVTLDRLAAEIAKCDVVCANCHAVRTAQRRSGR